MTTFYSIITVFHDNHTDTVDYPVLDAALKEYNYRKKLMNATIGAILSVRILRISSTQVLDITPGQEDTN